MPRGAQLPKSFCERGAHRFSSGRARDLLQEYDSPRNFERRQLRGREAPEFQLGNLGVRTQDDSGRGFLLQRPMRNGKSSRVGQCGMAKQHMVYFQRNDFLASPADHFLLPSSDEQETVAIHPADVSGVKPSIAEGRLIGDWIVQVTLRQGWGAEPG